jgi:hypothetical protein
MKKLTTLLVAIGVLFLLIQFITFILVQTKGTWAGF